MAPAVTGTPCGAPPKPTRPGLARLPLAVGVPRPDRRAALKPLGGGSNAVQARWGEARVQREISTPPLGGQILAPGPWLLAPTGVAGSSPAGKRQRARGTVVLAVLLGLQRAQARPSRGAMPWLPRTLFPPGAEDRRQTMPRSNRSWPLHRRGTPWRALRGRQRQASCVTNFAVPTPPARRWPGARANAAKTIARCGARGIVFGDGLKPRRALSASARRGTPC